MTEKDELNLFPHARNGRSKDLVQRLSTVRKILNRTGLESVLGLCSILFADTVHVKPESQLTVSRLLPVAWVGPGTARAPEL